MANLVTAFRGRYPEFSAVDDNRLSISIGDAELQISAKAWGKLYEQGVLALAAHLLAIAPKGNGKGSPFPISNKTAGSLSIGYAVPSLDDKDDSFYKMTAYGQRYLQLRQLIARHIKVVQWPLK